jgi:hypothetical protein
MDFKFKTWHLVAVILVIIYLLTSTSVGSTLLSLVGLGPSFTWSYECVETHTVQDTYYKECLLDSPNSITSGPKWEFSTEAPMFECTSEYPPTYIAVEATRGMVNGQMVDIPAVMGYNRWWTGNTPSSCWSVTATLNGKTKKMYKGDEWIINDYVKITLDDVYSGIKGGHFYDAPKVTYSFFIDQSGGISAQFEDPFPLVAFREEHTENVLVTNKIMDFDGGFLVNKKQETFFTMNEGWQDHSEDGIPMGLSSAPLAFMVWDLGDNQYKVIPYINFSSSKTYTEVGCEEDCKTLTMTTLKTALMSTNYAEKTTRTLVGQTDADKISIITVQKNKWMDQYKQLYLDGKDVKTLNIAKPIDLATNAEPESQLSRTGAIIILSVLGIGVAIAAILIFKPKFIMRRFK